MLLDGPRKVVFEVAAHRQSVLRTVVHRLRINIIALLRILPEPSFLAPTPEVIDRFGIRFRRMFIGDRLEVNFGFDDMQQ